jgi:nitrite reductase/ring-hydroxylating ferredoxin subunit
MIGRQHDPKTNDPKRIVEVRMSRFIFATKADHIIPGTGKLVVLGDIDIAVFNADGAFYALDNACPFHSGSLSDGIIAGSVVKCRMDGAEFFLPTGECLSTDEGKDVRAFRVRVNGENIAVDLGSAIDFPDTTAMDSAASNIDNAGQASI